MQPKPNRKQLTLSPEALGALRLPLTTDGDDILTGDDIRIAEIRYTDLAPYRVRVELAAFIAALVNEALTPAEPHRNCHARAECETDCPWRDNCDNAALEPVTACEYDDCPRDAMPGGDFCAEHQALQAERAATEA